MGDYDFDEIAGFARKRYIEGCDTVSLMQQARSRREKEEIALVCMLDIDNDQIRAIDLCCPYGSECRIMDCRERLTRMISRDLPVH
jgi:hypothetical protein